MANPEVIIAADLGSTSIQFGVVGPHGLSAHESIPTPRQPEELCEQVAGRVADFAETFDTDVAVLGFPGLVTHDNGTTLVGPMPNVAGFPEPVEISKNFAAADSRIADLRTLLLNDAEIGVHYLPTLLDQEPNDTLLFYVVHGTGFGVDGIKHNRTLRQNGFPMEIGHTPLTYQRPRDAETRRVSKPLRELPIKIDTLEQRVSGKGIARVYGHARRTLEDMVDRGSPAIWHQVGRDLARGLVQFVPVFGMSHIVIGGRVSRAHQYYETAFREQFATSYHAIPDKMAAEPVIEFVPEDMVDTIGLQGAYHAARRHGMIS